MTDKIKGFRSDLKLIEDIKKRSGMLEERVQQLDSVYRGQER